VRAHLASVMAALRQAEVAPAGSDSGSDVADVG
jgi:hypothetical protein